jgi:hypothetical protein
MIGDLLYSVEVDIIRFPGDGEVDGVVAASVRQPTIVRYCDICRRWGPNSSTHLCWRNWKPRLSDLLMELAREGGR